MAKWDTDNGSLFTNPSTAKVGIGTSRPVADLEIHNKYPTLRLNDSDGNNWQLRSQAGNFQLNDITNGGNTPLTIEDGANRHSLYIDDRGKVGMGTNTPGEKLEVNGNLQFSKGADREIRVEAEDATTAGRNLTLKAGDAGTSAGTQDGGHVIITPGDKGPSGEDGFIKLDGDARMKGPWADIRAYGAVPNAPGQARANVTAIQAALDSGSSYVLIPSGVWYTNGTLQIPNYVEVFGMGSGYSQQGGMLSKISYSGKRNAIEAKAAGPSNVWNIKLRNLAIAVTGAKAKAVHLRHARSCSIENVSLILEGTDQTGLYFYCQETCYCQGECDPTSHPLACVRNSVSNLQIQGTPTSARNTAIETQAGPIGKWGLFNFNNFYGVIINYVHKGVVIGRGHKNNFFGILLESIENTAMTFGEGTGKTTVWGAYLERGRFKGQDPVPFKFGKSASGNTIIYPRMQGSYRDPVFHASAGSYNRVITEETVYLKDASETLLKAKKWGEDKDRFVMRPDGIDLGPGGTADFDVSISRTGTNELEIKAGTSSTVTIDDTKLDVDGNLQIKADGSISPLPATGLFDFYVANRSEDTQYGNLHLQVANNGSTGFRAYPRDLASTTTKPSRYGIFTYQDESVKAAFVGTNQDKKTLAVTSTGRLESGLRALARN